MPVIVLWVAEQAFKLDAPTWLWVIAWVAWLFGGCYHSSSSK